MYRAYNAADKISVNFTYTSAAAAMINETETCNNVTNCLSNGEQTPGLQEGGHGR
jgi:hypothetical protein